MLALLGALRRDTALEEAAVLRRRTWAEAQPLRQLVLGWPAGPVPGDLDELACHLFATGPAGGDVGVVSFMPHPCPSRPTDRALYLWGMAVHPAAQHTGHGTRLVRAVLANAYDNDMTVVWADARLTAVSFYERLGAVPNGDQSVDDVTGLTDQRVLFDLSTDLFKWPGSGPVPGG